MSVLVVLVALLTDVVTTVQLTDWLQVFSVAQTTVLLLVVTRTCKDKN